MKKILLLPFILLLLVSFGYADLITDGISITPPCGETKFEVLNQADYNYLIYNDCQEWRFPRILTNIKTTFVDKGLNAKVIPLDIAEMNQNNTPDNYNDDWPAKTKANEHDINKAATNSEKALPFMINDGGMWI